MLETLLKLFDDNLRLSIRDCVLEGDVGLYNVYELVGQVVLRAHGATAHGDRWADVDGGDGHDRDAQPLWAGPSYVKAQRFHVLLAHPAEDLHGLGGGKELLPIATAGDAVHLVGELGLKMKADLGILWLVAVAVFALLPRAEVFVHGIQTAFAIEDTQVALELKLGLFDGDTAAVVADAPERLEDDRNEALVVHRAGQIDVAEVAGVGLVVQVPHTRVVGPAVDRLAIDLRLVPRDTGGDLAAVNGEGLRHRVLALLFCSQGLVPPRV